MATHYDITMGNDVAKDIHCDVTMSNDVACGVKNTFDWLFYLPGMSWVTLTTSLRTLAC